MTAKELIQKLNLSPHPEGGYYRETYRSAETMTVNGNTRNVSTAIYFLLEGENKSHFHRIKSDEGWFFHTGEAIEIIMLRNGMAETILLGNDLSNDEVPQAIVPAHTWFASHIKNKKGFAFVSCTVAPGFDFADFEMAKREELRKEFEGLDEVIKEFTVDE